MPGQLVLVALLLAVALVLVLWIASAAWNRKSRRLVQSLVSGASSAVPKEAPPGSLPAPVARYLELALPGGPTGKRLARIRHVGELRTGERFYPFESVEHFVASPPGLVWDARVRMKAGLSVRVRDGYVLGKGSMEARLLGLVPVLEARGRRELDEGAMQRFLAEAVWFPEALLPGPSLGWRELDETSAEARLDDGTNAIALTFTFNAAGEVLSVETARRYREVEGEFVPTPWRGRFWSWDRRGPFVVPLGAEVEWVLPEGPQPYWRGTVVAAEYEL